MDHNRDIKTFILNSFVEYFVVTSTRNRRIFQRYIDGLKYAEIGREFSITGNRVRQIILQVERKVRDSWSIHLSRHTHLEEEIDRLHEMRTDLKTILDRKRVDVPIDSIGFSIRAINSLKSAGVSTLNELSKITFLKMLRFRNMGRKSIQEIETAMEKHGFDFQ